MGAPVRSDAMRRIVELARQGLPRAEIAALVGRPMETVYNYLSDARRQGIPVPRAPVGRPPLALRDAAQAAVPVEPEVLGALAGEAARRGLTPAALAARLLAAIARDGLVDAVLDDEPAEPPAGNAFNAP